MALRDPEAGASPLALFGAELRHYRTAAGLSQEQLGGQIGYSAALVGAVETARRMPTEDFTARCDLVDELGTGGALLRLRAHLRDQLHRQVWPPWFREWPSIEREALSLRSWELAVIPGLLQTAGVRAGHAPWRTARRERGAGRGTGQCPAPAAGDLGAAGPADAVGDHGRGALRRRVGDAGIMREQLDHLIDVSRSPKVKVLVVPASAGAHVGLSGAFVIAEFREGPDVVYLDTAAQGQIADHPDIVKACDQVFDTLRAEALPPRASLDLIAEVRDTWT